MSIEELEASARRHLDSLLAIYGRLPPTQGGGDMLAYDLARAVIAMLPVVKAAEQWRVTDSCQTEPNSPGPCKCDECRAANAVCGALDAMRAALEGK